MKYQLAMFDSDGILADTLPWGQHDEATLRATNPAEVFSSAAEIAHKLI